MTENPYPEKKVTQYLSSDSHVAWQEGWEARCAWEQEPCTDHLEDWRVTAKDKTFTYKHRFQCPSCMEVK